MTGRVSAAEHPHGLQRLTGWKRLENVFFTQISKAYGYNMTSPTPWQCVESHKSRIQQLRKQHGKEECMCNTCEGYLPSQPGYRTVYSGSGPDPGPAGPKEKEQANTQTNKQTNDQNKTRNNTNQEQDNMGMEPRPDAIISNGVQRPLRRGSF